MAQHKHKKWLYTVAILLIVIPLLGIPQSLKTVLVIIIALGVAYIAFLLPEQKRGEETPAYIENEIDAEEKRMSQSSADETNSWEEKRKES